MKLKYRCAFSEEFLSETADDRLRLFTGEASPSYLLGGAKIAQRVLKLCDSEVKLVVLLRDPVKRACSQFAMMIDTTGTEAQLKRRGVFSANQAPPNFEEILNSEMSLIKATMNTSCIDLGLFERKFLFPTIDYKHGNHSYIVRGLYSLQLKSWFQVFPRENFHFIVLETFDENREEEMEKLFHFLGADDDLTQKAIKSIDFEHKNKRSYSFYKEMQAALLQLRQFYKPFNDELSKMLHVDLSKWEDNPSFD